jgi:hypothetical protein
MDERARIIAEARRSVASATEEARGWRLRQPWDEDVLERWRRQTPPEAPPRALFSAPNMDGLAEERVRGWEDWARMLIKQELAAERATLTEAAGQAMGQIRGELRDRIAALERRVEALAAEVVKLRGIERGEIIDLPPIRKRHDAT